MIPCTIAGSSAIVTAYNQIQSIFTRKRKDSIESRKNKNKSKSREGSVPPPTDD